VDAALDPLNYVGQGTTVTALKIARYGVSAVDTRAGVLDEVDNIKAQALDPYATFRSLYRQHRESQIEDTRDDDRATIPAWFAQPAPAPAQ
jgi:phospholipid-binding lipoprotein MlaA